MHVKTQESTAAGKSFSLDIQVIVDKEKHILWRFIGDKESSHDSPVFHDSELGQNLLSISGDLKRDGLYIVSDLAYAIRWYLLTPYNNVVPGTAKDTFNFF